MSAGTETHRQPGKLSRQLGALIAAQGAAGTKALAALQHHIFVQNVAPIGPGGGNIFAAPAFTPVGGHVRIWAQAILTTSGGTMVSGDQVVMEILRDGTPIPPGTPSLATMQVGANGPVDGVQLTLVVEDIVAAGSAHVWALQAGVFLGVHTSVILASQGQIIIQDLG
jgi:hypothetical protein